VAYEATVAEVLETLRFDTSQIPQTATQDGDLDKDAIERWIDAAKGILESHLSGSAASLSSTSDFGYDATLDYACYRAYQAEGLNPEPHRQEWEAARDKISEDPRSIASVQSDEVIRSNAGTGGKGEWVEGSDGDATFTGW